MTNDQRQTHAWRITDTSAKGNDERTSVSPAQERFYRIDEVHRRTSLSKRTLRYYEELGLLAPAQRSEGNYRLYSESDIRTLEHIIEMRDLLGLNLKQIREMVDAEMERERIKTQWKSDLDPSQRLDALDEAEQVARKELTLLEEKLRGLEEMRQTLFERLARYDQLRSEIRAQTKSAAEKSEGRSQSGSPAH